MRAELMRGTSWAAAAAWLAVAAPAWAAAPPLPGSTVPGQSAPGGGGTAGTSASVLSGADVVEGATSSPFPAAGEVRLGQLGYPYTSVAGPAAEPTQRGWSIVPSIGIEQLATDNIRGSRRNKEAEFVTSITPGVLVTLDTARAQGLVNYQPSFRYYANGTSESGIDHNFNGQVLLTLVPEMVFLDLRGSAARQAAGGGYAPGEDSVTSRDNTVQTSSFQISPYILQRIGGTATVQLGYAFQSVTQDAGDTASLLGPNGQPYYSSQDFTAHEVYGIIRSGEEFGRLALEGRVVSTDYIGTGVLDGAYRRIAAVEGRYAINRFITAIGEIGYEQQRYSGIPPFDLQEAVWSVGSKLNFTQDSFVTVRYGHHDGFDSASADASLALGGRTRLYARYGERLSTGTQRAADLLSSTTLDELGNPIDSVTGGPLTQPFSNSLLGVQNSLQRIKTANATISQDWGRDQFSLTLLREERRPVSVDPDTFNDATRGTSASLSWSHELTPATSGSAFVQYGTYESTGRGNGDVYSLGVTLASRLAPNLVGSVQLLTSSRSEEGSSGRALQNTIIAGLRQTF